MMNSLPKKYFLPFAVYVFFLVVLLNLGFWQLDRADEKQHLITQQQTRSTENPLQLTGEQTDISNLLYYPVGLKGRFDTGHQFLLENQIHDGKNGYFVFTPLIFEGNAGAVLVNRGWLPASLDRNIKPEIPLDIVEVELSGIVKNFPGVGLRLEGAEVPGPGWPAVVQLIDSNYLSDVLGYSLMPYQVLLDPAEPNGYLRDWKINYRITPDKHRAYAFQWFSLAVALTLLCGWLLFYKKK